MSLTRSVFRFILGRAYIHLCTQDVARLLYWFLVGEPRMDCSKLQYWFSAGVYERTRDELQEFGVVRLHMGWKSCDWRIQFP